MAALAGESSAGNQRVNRSIKMHLIWWSPICVAYFKFYPVNIEWLPLRSDFLFFLFFFLFYINVRAKSHWWP